MPFAGGIHYRKYSGGDEDKTPLVLIHGAGGSYLHWPSEIRRLSGENILAIDLPGHGKSGGEGEHTIDAYAQAVLSFLDELGLDQSILVGHSMGSAIAQWLCLDRPERVRGLILIGAGAMLRVHPDILQLSTNETTFPKVVSMVMAWAFSPQTPKRLVELAGERMAGTSPSVVHKDFLACDAFDIRARVMEIQQPALVICGSEDQMTPVRFSQFLIEELPEACLEIIPNAGHMVMLEQPETVANLITKFIEEFDSVEKRNA
jgi:pimeloyl-ACP methyl ester carboxylesterase